MPRHVLTDEDRKKTQFRSGDSAVTNGRKGGQNKAKNLQRMKTSKELMLAVMNAKPKMEAGARANLERLGITGILNGQGYTEDDFTIELIMNAAIAQRAMQGNVNAYKAIVEIMGEKPVQKVVVVAPDQAVADSVEAALFGDGE